MTCPEARQFSAALIAGELAISEAALVEAHLSHCADCRQIVEGLYQVAPRDPEGRIASADEMGIGAGSRLLLPLVVLVALGASAPAPWPRRASTRKPAESAATASPRSTERRQARQGEQAVLVEPAAPHLISPIKASETDVVVQISTRDRGVAERDINLLLVRLGGTNLGQAEGAAIVSVVPQSRYGEFTRGLAQIGSWNREASRSSLPDPVHAAG